MDADELHSKIVPFVACGDLCGYDSDRTYSLQASRCIGRRMLTLLAGGTHCPGPDTAPYDPPYKWALSRKRQLHP